MKKSKILILCAVLTASVFMATGCGNSGNNDTQAPYEDETQNGVNSRNGMNGGTMQDDNDTGSSLRDAGRNLMDSVEDAGNSIRDGVNNIINDGTNRNGLNGTNGVNGTNGTGAMNGTSGMNGTTGMSR